VQINVKPLSLIFPAVGFIMPEINFDFVVFPARFGPAMGYLPD
jgi:hypothetical protein